MCRHRLRKVTIVLSHKPTTNCPWHRGLFAGNRRVGKHTRLPASLTVAWRLKIHTLAVGIQRVHNNNVTGSNGKSLKEEILHSKMTGTYQINQMACDNANQVRNPTPGQKEQREQQTSPCPRPSERRGKAQCRAPSPLPLLVRCAVTLEPACYFGQ